MIAQLAMHFAHISMNGTLANCRHGSRHFACIFLGILLRETPSLRPKQIAGAGMAGMRYVQKKECEKHDIPMRSVHISVVYTCGGLHAVLPLNGRMHTLTNEVKAHQCGLHMGLHAVLPLHGGMHTLNWRVHKMQTRGRCPLTTMQMHSRGLERLEKRCLLYATGWQLIGGE